MRPDIEAYNAAQSGDAHAICTRLAASISAGLPDADAKIWHRAPVWFLEGNPVVGYWSRKGYVSLLFWSGQSFGEPLLEPNGSFQAAQRRIHALTDIVPSDLSRWLQQARAIQWDYRNIVRRRGVLEKLGSW